jgi:Carboxypeptidase regulatory-like domain
VTSGVRRGTSGWLDTDRLQHLGRILDPAHARLVRILLVLLVAASCATTTVQRPRPTTGGIAGLARDHDSGDPVAKAEIRLRAIDGKNHVTTSSDNGLYDIESLAPGKYALVAIFAGQPVEVTNIDVHAGKVTMVDIVFTLGRPEPIRVDFGNKASQIDHYKPRNGSPMTAIIEGTVNDTATKERVVGAVVTAATGDIALTQQTISDDQGRFRFEARPGVYSVSAYYSIGGRAQIEVRRSNITVDGAEAVHVPLWIEMDR